MDTGWRYIMKKGSEDRWLIFSVFAVVIPVALAIVLSGVVTSKMPDLLEHVDSIILVGFSMACSLFSVSWDVYHQKRDKRIKRYIWISGFFVFLSWTFYVISLIITNDLWAKILILCSLASVCYFSYSGYKLGKKSDDNENEITYEMHKNCNLLRKKLLSNDEEKLLKTHVCDDYALLCRPDNIKGVNDLVKIILMNRKNEYK